MKVKCDYCGTMYDDKELRCPSCGGQASKIDRTSNGQPKTIEELQQWFKDNGYTYEKTRFFIGIDMREPKAFGIYRNENGDVVVYKNKNTGERAIRYQGSDEEYGVNEIYQRFQQEIINQKNIWLEKKRNGNISSQTATTKSKATSVTREIVAQILTTIFILFSLIILMILSTQINLGVFVLTIPLMLSISSICLSSYFSDKNRKENKEKYSYKKHWRPLVRFLVCTLVISLFINGISIFINRKNGYYSIDNELYYKAGSNWYHYETYNDYYDDDYYDEDDYFWHEEYYVPAELTSSSWNEYKNTNDFEYSYEDFEDTSYYDDWKSSSSSSDSGYDSGWSSDSWDSGGTDWGSDW